MNLKASDGRIQSA